MLAKAIAHTTMVHHAVVPCFAWCVCWHVLMCACAVIHAQWCMLLYMCAVNCTPTCMKNLVWCCSRPMPPLCPVLPRKIHCCVMHAGMHTAALQRGVCWKCCLALVISPYPVPRKRRTLAVSWCSRVSALPCHRLRAKHMSVTVRCCCQEAWPFDELDASLAYTTISTRAFSLLKYPAFQYPNNRKPY